MNENIIPSVGSKIRLTADLRTFYCGGESMPTVGDVGIVRHVYGSIISVDFPDRKARRAWVIHYGDFEILQAEAQGDTVNEITWGDLNYDQRNLMRCMYGGFPFYANDIEMPPGLIVFDKSTGKWFLTDAGRALLESAATPAEDGVIFDVTDIHGEKHRGIWLQDGNITNLFIEANVIDQKQAEIERLQKELATERSQRAVAQSETKRLFGVIELIHKQRDKQQAKMERLQAENRALVDLSIQHAELQTTWEQTVMSLTGKLEEANKRVSELLASADEADSRARKAQADAAAMRERAEKAENQMLVSYDEEFGAYIFNVETIDYILLTNSEESVWVEAHPAFRAVIDGGYATIRYRHPYVEDMGAGASLTLTVAGEQRKRSFLQTTRAGAELLARLEQAEAERDAANRSAEINYAEWQKALGVINLDDDDESYLGETVLKKLNDNKTE